MTTDRLEPTEHMVRAAAKAGQETGLPGSGSTAEAIARVMLAAALEVMPRHYTGPHFPFQIRNLQGFGIRKVRIVSTSEQPGYFRIECEDGQQMVLHANEILPNRRPRQIDQQQKERAGK